MNEEQRKFFLRLYVDVLADHASNCVQKVGRGVVLVRESKGVISLTYAHASQPICDEFPHKVRTWLSHYKPEAHMIVVYVAEEQPPGVHSYLLQMPTDKQKAKAKRDRERADTKAEPVVTGYGNGKTYVGGMQELMMKHDDKHQKKRAMDMSQGARGSSNDRKKPTRNDMNEKHPSNVSIHASDEIQALLGDLYDRFLAGEQLPTQAECLVCGRAIRLREERVSLCSYPPIRPTGGKGRIVIPLFVHARCGESRIYTEEEVDRIVATRPSEYIEPEEGMLFENS